MKVTIEEIEGENHTVIAKPDIKRDNGLIRWNDISGFYVILDYGYQVEAVALPPLPRNPTADDARLLHLYASHGLDVCGFYFSPLADDHNKVNNTKEIINIITCDALDLTITVITHAINEQNESVEIAIYDREL